ncbi:uncharacterized protein LOC126802550 [Argentina anserina]|uniref:uncharacterized protein LOC126802550 n=1 Tax=Argentina anserina TaxID=57926 RepID=UPI00217626A9|nr:uncharacterized protein LOC126802550 [Potentilla anserina]
MSVQHRYEVEVGFNPQNHKAWLAYIGLEEDAGANKNRIRDLFRRAIAIVPPVRPEFYYWERKRLWRYYVELWIYYATYEEGHGGDAAQVYEQCLAVIPHDQFSFAKCGFALPVWSYDTGKVSRVWVRYAEFERGLGETERVRALFELGIVCSELYPELVWKSYIDFEASEGRTEKSRQLYERLLDHAKQHVRVWASYARFEAQVNHSVENARMVFRRAAPYYVAWNEFDRDILRKQWLDVEASFGDLGDAGLVDSHLPKLKRSRSEEFFVIDDES